MNDNTINIKEIWMGDRCRICGGGAPTASVCKSPFCQAEALRQAEEMKQNPPFFTVYGDEARMPIYNFQQESEYDIFKRMMARMISEQQIDLKTEDSRWENIEFNGDEITLYTVGDHHEVKFIFEHGRLKKLIVS